MPRYHKLPDNWKDRGKFTTIPRPFWRCLWPLKAICPYHVGDRIKFRVYFTRPNLKTNISQVVYEKFGDNFYKKNQPLRDINQIDSEIIGSIIDGEYDIKYYVGSYGNLTDIEPIFTTRVESWDTIISKWGWVIVGAFFTLLCGALIWFLNFLQIVPVYKIWIQK